MSITHKHQWAEVRRTYSESIWERAVRAGVSEMQGARYTNQAAMDRATHGFTNIELACEACGDVKFVQAIGDVT